MVCDLAAEHSVVGEEEMATDVRVRNLQLVNPTGLDMDPGQFRLTARPESLAGKTLGLLENTKANSDRVLEELGNILASEYEFKGILQFSKHSASLPTKPEVINEILESCDVLVVGVGD